MRETERASNGYGAWPWRDGGAWITDVRAALRAWLQVPFAVRTACFAQHTQMKVKICKQTFWAGTQARTGILGAASARAGGRWVLLLYVCRHAATSSDWVPLAVHQPVSREKKMYNQV